MPSNEPRYYFTNVFSMMFGDNDVVFNFGIEELQDDGNKKFLHQTGLAMTQRSAKILATALSAAIANYEAAQGPISMPDGKLETLVDLIKKQAAEANRPKKDEAAN